MSASFTALPGAPAVICRDGATVIAPLWMLTKDAKRVSCAIYRRTDGGVALRLFRNGVPFRDWPGADVEQLRADADEKRRQLEALGWEAM